MVPAGAGPAASHAVAQIDRQLERQTDRAGMRQIRVQEATRRLGTALILLHFVFWTWVCFVFLFFRFLSPFLFPVCPDNLYRGKDNPTECCFHLTLI